MERIMRDVGRVFLLMVITGLLLYFIDPVNSIIFQAVLIAIFQVGATHLTRRIMLPSLDLQSIAKDAVKEKNLAAAIVFAAIIFFLIAVMFLSTQVFK